MRLRNICESYLMELGVFSFFATNNCQLSTNITYLYYFAINHFAKFINIMSIQSKIYPPLFWRIPQVFAGLSCLNFYSGELFPFF